MIKIKRLSEKMQALFAKVLGQDQPVFLKSGPWPWELKNRSNPCQEKGIATMLTDEECRMLRWITGSYYSGQGKVVDLGCFVGGSTVALASGLRDQGIRNQRLLHSYDLFILDKFAKENYLPALEINADLLPVFKQNTGEFSDLLAFTKGDILARSWNQEPIEILFLDILKSWKINDHILREFFPHLIPGRSLIIQQDYLHEWLPWIHITMEQLRPYLRLVGFTAYNSVVFRLIKPLPPRALKACQWQSMTQTRKMQIMQKVENRWKAPHQDYLRKAKCFLKEGGADRLNIV